MKILITGSSGYIGKHLYKYLSANHEIYGCDIKDSLDLTDYDKTFQFIDRIRPELIIHLAAYVRVDESQTEPHKYYSNNIQSTINILNCMKQLEIKKIIFSSTAAVYKSATKPLKETDMVDPQSVYGKSKLICEQLIEDYSRAYGINAIVFRFFNVCGGSLPEHFVHLFPILFDRIKRGLSLDIFGNDYCTRDGTCVRDYLSINDLMVACDKAILFLQKEREKDSFNVFNLGTQNGSSVADIVSFFLFFMKDKYTITNIKVNYTKRRAGDTDSLTADPEKALLTLNWKATERVDKIIEDFVNNNT
jgi:UDP-glucose 4-epimerase